MLTDHSWSKVDIGNDSTKGPRVILSCVRTLSPNCSWQVQSRIFQVFQTKKWNAEVVFAGLYCTQTANVRWRELKRQRGAHRHSTLFSVINQFYIRKKEHSVPFKHASGADARTSWLEKMLEAGPYSAFIHSVALMRFFRFVCVYSLLPAVRMICVQIAPSNCPSNTFSVVLWGWVKVMQQEKKKRKSYRFQQFQKWSGLSVGYLSLPL